jgi:hypothetical protein
MKHNETRSPSEYVTADDLRAHGMTPDDMERLCPGAVEYRALDGSACWLRSELSPILQDAGETRS